MATLSRAQAIPLADYATGTHTLPEVNIQTQATKFHFEVRRCTSVDLTIWPDASTTLELILEVSFDNGNTWIERGRATAVGGIHVLRNGTQAPITALQIDIGTGNQRKCRGAVIVTNGPLRTEGFIETRT
jgi:hypothetical protein